MSSAAAEGSESRSSAPTASSVPPTAEQLATSRAERWHQDGQALLSHEGLRDWVRQAGLVAYKPRAWQLGAPSPTLMEAVAGKKLEGELSEIDPARTLMAGLVAEGGAVPLNLLGASGGLGTDVPDFVASAAVFSYVFTLRGNKAWKQAPATSGAVKVTPLALAVYEMLGKKVTLSSYDLATQLGKEVTEGAVLRALTELWGQLRVLPVPQVDGTATLWELTTARFTKQIKAGANAGQPSALSALISLYLGQAVAASEDELETFLSPLAARSRVRDVIHALLAARQLETVVVEGKTLLHVSGDLPGFAVIAEAGAELASDGSSGDAGEGSRITKFASKPGGKIGTGLRTKPGFGKKAGAAAKPYGARPGSGDRERRPFKKDAGAGFSKPRFDRPSFDKPWSEDRKPGRVSGGESVAASAAGSGETRPPRREYPARVGEGGAGAKRTFSKPGTFGRKREGFAGKPAPDQGEIRKQRKEFGGADVRPAGRGAEDRGERPADGGFKRTGAGAGAYSMRPKPTFGEKPSFGARPFADRSSPRTERGPASDGGETGRKVYRKFDAPREKKPFVGKPSFAGKPSFGGKTSEGRAAGPKTFSDRPASDGPARRSDGARRSERPTGDGATRSERPRTGFSARSGSSGGRGGVDGGKKPFANAGGPFAKFADGKKPFRKPGPGKKPASGGRSEGGFKPVKRRPEGKG